MVVFQCSKPTNPDEERQLTRGVNDSYCFYDDFSLWGQCKLDADSCFPIAMFLYRLITGKA